MDAKGFPLFAERSPEVAQRLCCCSDLLFLSAGPPEIVERIILEKGRAWHEYGDVRPGCSASWIEIPTASALYPGFSGILTLTFEIPDACGDPFEWASRDGPVAQLEPAERAEAAVLRRTAMLRGAAARAEQAGNPADMRPRFAQSHWIFRKTDDVRLVGLYSDFLNKGGVPIPSLRTATVEPCDMEVCRFSLHALYMLLETEGLLVEIKDTAQLSRLEPAQREEGEIPKLWENYHPMRTLRLRPKVQTVRPSQQQHPGALNAADVEAVHTARHAEFSTELAAFERDARPAEPRYHMADFNATLTAWAHRESGGAIYSLPAALVEEFDHTSCEEVRMADLQMPFSSYYLSFTPPSEITLGESAVVDGCYVTRQGEEIMLTLTSRRRGASYARSISIACVDTSFTLHLQLKDAAGDSQTVVAATEQGIANFLEEHRPPEKDESQWVDRPDGTRTYVQDIRAASRLKRIAEFQQQEPAFRQCLNIIVNAMCFVAFRPEDVSDEWHGSAPTWVRDALADTSSGRRARDRKKSAERAINAGEYVRIRVCGKNLFGAVADGRRDGTGDSPRPHWRRGHWRRQRHGEKLSQVTLKWIRPTIVRREDGPVVDSRIYEIPHPNAAKSG